VAGALGDNASALFAVIGTLGALRQRDRSGMGQHIDVAIYDSMVAINDMLPFMWSMGLPPVMCTPRHFALVASFRARDGWFVIACFREHQFERLANMLGHPEWLRDPRFATRDGWGLHKESVLRPAIEAWAATMTRLEATHALSDAGIAASPCQSSAEVRVDPHLTARDMLVEMERTDGVDEPVLIPGNPVKLSNVAEGPETRVPWLGEHTAEVLADELGLDAGRIEALRAEGVIA